MSDDFFGDLGKSISRATQSAVDRTSNFFESTKISTQITQEQKEIEKIYMKIGESVARKVEAGAADCVGEKERGMVSDVHAHLDRILELKQELAGVKGMKICPNCQRLVDSNAAFCPKCGAPMPVEEETGTEAEPEEAESTSEAERAREKAAKEAEEEEILDASFDTVEDLSSVVDDVMDAGFTTIDDKTGDSDISSSEEAAEAEFVILEDTEKPSGQPDSKPSGQPDSKPAEKPDAADAPVQKNTDAAPQKDADSAAPQKGADSEAPKNS